MALIHLAPDRVTGSGSGSSSSDDFLIIIADDQSASRFWSSVRPNPTTQLEILAANATIFKQAYCPASVCNASRTALLTCKPPYLNGIFENREDPRRLRTVLTHLKGNGYKLRAVGKVFHSRFELNGVFASAADPKPKRKTRVELERRGSGTTLAIGVNQAKAGRDSSALKAGRTLLSIRRSNPADKNGFIVGFTATHLPFFVPNSRRYSKAYNPKRIRLPVETYPRPEFARVLDRKYRISQRRRKEVIARYLGCLRYDSDQAARVIRAFQKKYPEGHVVFLSDHGFLLDEGRSWGKADTLEVACRVPYFVWSNQLPAGKVTGPISTGTAFPLLLDLCGVPPFPEAHWESPREWIEDGKTPAGHVVYTYAGRREWLRATRGNTVYHWRGDETFVTGLDDRPRNR